MPTKRRKKDPNKPAKKKPKHRLDLDRPYCNGDWTIARMRSFVMSALRGARWAPKFDVIDRARIGKGINPATGHPCILHKCEQCGGMFPKGGVKADHVEPVIPVSHDWENLPNNFLGYDFNDVMRRLWIEMGDGWSVICEACHTQKTEQEKKERLAAATKFNPMGPTHTEEMRFLFDRT